MAEFVANCPKLIDVINERSIEPWVSVEFFPPKTTEGVKTLFKVANDLKNYNPIFADFTWGAGGSTSDLTVELCIRAKNEAGLTPNMHLTCTNMEKEKIHIALEQCRKNGIRNILALRGDPPVGQEAWTATEGGLSCALDLVKYIREHNPDEFFSISVAGYPEGHPTKMTNVSGGLESLSESEKSRCSFDVDENGNEAIFVCKDADYEGEMSYLKAKVDAGACFIVTQMFFDPEVYGIFVKDCRDRDIMCPIVPGIMSVSSYGGFKRMTRFCRTRVTHAVSARLESIKDSEEAVKIFGIDYGVEMCHRLLELGAPGLHFYTLNTARVTKAILEKLQLPSTAHAPHAPAPATALNTATATAASVIVQGAEEPAQTN